MNSGGNICDDNSRGLKAEIIQSHACIFFKILYFNHYVNLENKRRKKCQKAQ